MTSPADRIASLQGQLDVQRRATAIYQDAQRKLVSNLEMLGRGDVAKSIANETLRLVQAIPQPKGTDDDDDLAG